MEERIMDLEKTGGTEAWKKTVQVDMAEEELHSLTGALEATHLLALSQKATLSGMSILFRANTWLKELNLCFSFLHFQLPSNRQLNL